MPGALSDLLLWTRRHGRDPGSFVAISAEALGRYKLRTTLSVLGVVLGVAAVSYTHLTLPTILLV